MNEEKEPKSRMHILRLTYRLSEEEYEEALLCLGWKQEGMFKNINFVILTVIGVLVLIAYIQDPERFFCVILLAFIIVILFYIAYGTKSRRKRKAKKMAAQKGTYRVEIRKDRIIYGDKREEIRPEKIKPGDSRRKKRRKRTEFFSSENLYVIKVKTEVFIIPKRILDADQEKLLREWARENQARTIRIQM